MLAAVATSMSAATAVAGQAMLASIRAQAQERPGVPAVRADGKSLDYAILLDSAERMAAALHERGMQHNDVVALMAERDPPTLVLMLAILLGGGACLPLDAGYPAARLCTMLEDARPRLLVAEPDAGARLPAVVGMTCCGHLALELRSAAMTALAPVPTAGELAYVLFTSGSTGRPKGVAMRSAALAHLIACPDAAVCAAELRRFIPGNAFDLHHRRYARAAHAGRAPRSVCATGLARA